jgi:DNA (cytosine-5)-methyltransferase 1
MILLDVCSCAGVGADGYARAGWEVVCLDNDPKALKHNPHQTILGDAMRLLADRGFLRQFHAIHASFPCQGWSACRQLANAQGRGRGRAVDLLTPGLPLLRASGLPWVVENVNRSPVRHMPGAVRLCGSSWGLKVERHRWFAPSPDLTLTGSVCNHAAAFDRDPITGKPRPWGVYYSKGDSIPSGGRTCTTDEHAHECMGVERRVPWPFLCEGLPPVYTEFLGRQMLAAIGGAEAA